MIKSKEILTSTQLTQIFLLGLVLLAGFILRIDAYFLWQAYPDQYLVQGEPIVVTPDGYYYLNNAKELLNGTYSSIDSSRVFPDGVQRSSIPSLLPTLLVAVTKITGLSLNWIAAVTPVVLGLLIIIPLYLFGHYWGGFLMGITSAAMGALAHYYAARTSLGVLDTDCLNVTLPLMCAFLFMRFGTCKTVKRYWFLSGGIICFLLFYWWWDMSAGAVYVLALTPLCVALVFHFRLPKHQLLIYTVIALVLTLFFLTQDNNIISNTFNSLSDQFAYISKQDTGLFANIGLSIAEQQQLSLRQVNDVTIGNWPVLIVSLTGFLWFILKKKSEALYLIPVFLLGLFSLLFARRFSIFLAPVVAIGFGFFLSQLYKRLSIKKTLLISYCLIFSYLIFNSHMLGTGQSRLLFPAPIIQGMKNTSQITPEDAVIWSWWDEGHPLVYWSDRATVSDGYIHGGILTFYNALPLATDNFQIAANFMQFYAVHGKKGVRHVMGASGKDLPATLKQVCTILSQKPEIATDLIQKMELKPIGEQQTTQDWLEYFFPANPPPIYLFLDSHMIAVERWIYWIGTWQTTTHAGEATLPTITINNVTFDKEHQPVGNALPIDYQKGTFSADELFDNPVLLRQIHMNFNTKTELLNYTQNQSSPDKQIPFTKKLRTQIQSNEQQTENGSYVMELSEASNKIILHDEKKANSVFNRLYFRANSGGNSYFNLVDRGTQYQTWKVTGDTVHSEQTDPSIPACFDIDSQ